MDDYPDNERNRQLHQVGYLHFDDYGESLGSGEELSQDLQTYSRKGSAFSSRYSSRRLQAESGYYDDVSDQIGRSGSGGRTRVDYDQYTHSTSSNQNQGYGRGYGRGSDLGYGQSRGQGQGQGRNYDQSFDQSRAYSQGQGQNRGYDQGRSQSYDQGQGRTIQRSQRSTSRQDRDAYQGTRLYDIQYDDYDQRDQHSQYGQYSDRGASDGRGSAGRRGETRIYDAEEDRAYQQRPEPRRRSAQARSSQRQDQYPDQEQEPAARRQIARGSGRSREPQEMQQRSQQVSHRRSDPRADSSPARGSQGSRNSRTAASYSRSNYTGPEAQERSRHTASLSGSNPLAKTRRRDKASSYERDPNGYARNASRNDEALRARKRKRRKRVFAAVGALILLLALAVGGVFAYARITMAKPFYTLVLGTDSDGGDYERTDSIMLVRVDPPNKKAALISLPRDTYVTMPGYEFHKLNSAFAYGDVELMVETVEQLVGVDIPYYVTLNYDGLCQSVDDLGGIEVDVPVYINARSSEGDPLWDLHGNVLPDVEPGYQTLDGLHALTMCRSRDYKSADFMRTAMQRLVLEGIARKVMNGSPKEIYTGITSILGCINTNLNAMQLFVCAMFMRGMDTSQDIWTLLAPCEDVWIDDVAYVQLDKDEMKTVINQIENGIEPVAQIDEY